MPSSPISATGCLTNPCFYLTASGGGRVISSLVDRIVEPSDARRKARLIARLQAKQSPESQDQQPTSGSLIPPSSLGTSAMLSYVVNAARKSLRGSVSRRRASKTDLIGLGLEAGGVKVFHEDALAKGSGESDSSTSSMSTSSSTTSLPQGRQHSQIGTQTPGSNVENDGSDSEEDLPNFSYGVPRHITSHYAQPQLSLTSATGRRLGHSPRPQHFQCRACGRIGTVLSAVLLVFLY